MVDALDASLKRRLNAEPIAYITGSQEFWSIELHTAPGTLVPRADTEILVDKALDLASDAPEGVILDLGTGTGAIAIAVACELPHRQIVAIERSDAALRVAHNNIRAQTSANLHLVQGSWLDALADDSIAMVLSNPPYLADNDPHLDQLRCEPMDALISGSTGLEDLEHIIAKTARVGKNNAPLIVEHGNQQAADVRTLMLDYNYAGVDTGLDLAGHERISFGYVVKASL